MKSQVKTEGHYHIEKLINQDLSNICAKLSIVKEKLSRGLVSLMQIKDDIELSLNSARAKLDADETVFSQDSSFIQMQPESTQFSETKYQLGQSQQNSLQAQSILSSPSPRQSQSSSASPYSFEKSEANQIGYLLPLECGHNGLFSKSELSALEFHLIRSGFAKC